MQIFASTTFFGSERTRVTEVVAMMRDLSLDGIELGSTHVYEPEASLLALRNSWRGRFVTHNFFPPSTDEDFVLNIASPNDALRAQAVAYCRRCIEIASKLGAELYTVHPGFLAAPLEAASKRGASHYDFRFSADPVPYNVAFAAMLESLEALLDYSQSLNIQLAIETEGSVSKQGVLLMERPEEYEALFARLPRMRINFNLAHTSLSACVHSFEVAEFVRRFGSKFVAVELSHNDGHHDQHAPLVSDSYVLSWLDKLPDVPLILEFRGATIADIESSVRLMRAAQTQGKNR